MRSLLLRFFYFTTTNDLAGNHKDIDYINKSSRKNNNQHIKQRKKERKKEKITKSKVHS